MRCTWDAKGMRVSSFQATSLKPRSSTRKSTIVGGADDAAVATDDDDDDGEAEEEEEAVAPLEMAPVVTDLEKCNCGPESHERLNIPQNEARANNHNHNHHNDKDTGPSLRPEGPHQGTADDIGALAAAGTSGRANPVSQSIAITMLTPNSQRESASSESEPQKNESGKGQGPHSLS